MMRCDEHTAHLQCGAGVASAPPMHGSLLIVKTTVGWPAQGAVVQHVQYRHGETSGRRMAAWGPWKTTRLHFHIGMLWWFSGGTSPEKLQATYDEHYGDAIR